MKFNEEILFLGGDLFTYLRHTGKFVEKHVKFYAAQVFLAFEYLHHFDILWVIQYISLIDFCFCFIDIEIWSKYDFYLYS